jgi:TctA family transporter
MPDARALAEQGKADFALGTALVCSVVGGLFGAIILMLLGHQLARIATLFSAAEYFWLYLLGLSCAVVVSSGSKLNALLALTIGLLLSTVGLSAVHTEARFTFGLAEMYNGISFIPAMIGLFGVSEVFNNLVRMSALEARDNKYPAGEKITRTGLFDRFILEPVKAVVVAGGALLLKRKTHALRSGGIGALIGMLPGAGADIAAWVSIAVSKRFSKKPDDYGKGSIEGIADATTSNNAALAGAWIPALVFGIPGDSITAIVIGVLMMKNITPGPDIFIKQASLVYAIYLIFILANLVLLPIGLLAIKAGTTVVRIPRRVLMPIILLFCVVGSYALNGSYFDIVTMLIMGLLGFILERHKIPLAPVVLGLLLGPVVEERFIQVMTGADGFIGGFLNSDRPVALGLGLGFFLLWSTIIFAGGKKLIRKSVR